MSGLPRVHWLQHADFEDLGCIAPYLAARGITPTLTRLWAGERLPGVDAFDALIVMGGPMNIYEYDAHPWLKAEKALIREALAANKKLLGLCLGSQLIADQLGGPVTRGMHHEIGWFPIELTQAGRAHPLFKELPDSLLAFHWHGDTWALPPGAELLAGSEACAHQAFAYDGTRVLGLQCHFEVTAANARDWLQHETPTPERYVQAAEEMLSEVGRFGANNRWMVQLVDRWLGQQ